MKDLLKKGRERVWLEGDPERDWSVGLLVAGLAEIVLGIIVFSFAMLLMLALSKTGLGILKPIHLWQVMFLLTFHLSLILKVYLNDYLQFYRVIYQVNLKLKRGS